MESNEIQPALAAAVEEILETMYFSTVLASAEGSAPSEGSDTPAITAEVHFEGSPSGGFRVSLPVKLARVVGAAFLGQEEEEVSDPQAGEVVCELANMICGSVLSRLKKDAIFQITHPELASTEPGAGFDGADRCRWFDLGDGFLTVSWELQQTV